MTDQPRRVPWVLLCPHHGVRAELELEVERGRAIVRDCSVKASSVRRPCDQGCMSWFGRPADETPAQGEVLP